MKFLNAPIWQRHDAVRKQSNTISFSCAENVSECTLWASGRAFLEIPPRTFSYVERGTSGLNRYWAASHYREIARHRIRRLIWSTFCHIPFMSYSTKRCRPESSLPQHPGREASVWISILCGSHFRCEARKQAWRTSGLVTEVDGTVVVCGNQHEQRTLVSEYGT